VSRIKSKTRDVLAEGEASRKTITPKIDGAPLRVYRWWARETDNEYLLYPTFSFCHYFWVVVLWAPLLRIRQLTRLDKLPMPRLPGGKFFDRLLIAVLVVQLLLILGSISVKLWPGFGWWSPLVATAVFLVSTAGTIAVVVLAIAVIVCIDKLVKAIKRHRTVRRLPEPVVPTQSVTKRVLGTARSAGRTGGEFVVLVGQKARVTKWKFCPLVEIPPEG